MPFYVANKPSLNHSMRESAKKHKKAQKRILARNIKHMTIVFYSNHFNTILYTKKWCVPFFVAYKRSMNHFMRESAKNAKKPQKCNLAHNIKHMTIIFDSNHLNKIFYTKYCCVPSFMANKPRLNHFMLESTKNA